MGRLREDWVSSWRTHLGRKRRRTEGKNVAFPNLFPSDGFPGRRRWACRDVEDDRGVARVVAVQQTGRRDGRGQLSLPGSSNSLAHHKAWRWYSLAVQLDMPLLAYLDGRVTNLIRLSCALHASDRLAARKVSLGRQTRIVRTRCELDGEEARVRRLVVLRRERGISVRKVSSVGGGVCRDGHGCRQ